MYNEDQNKTNTNVHKIAPIGIVVIISIIFLFLAYDHKNFVEWAFSSDTLLPSSLGYDIQHFKNVTQWFQLPRVESFFPDLLLYETVDIATGSWRWAHFAFGCCALLALVLLSGSIVGITSNRDLTQGATCFTIILLPILGFELYITDPHQFPVHFFLFRPTTHSGPYLAAVAASISLWKLIERQKAYRHYFILIFLSVAGALSDQLFYLEFFIPAIGTLILIAWLRMTPWKPEVAPENRTA